MAALCILIKIVSLIEASGCVCVLRRLSKKGSYN